MELIPRVKPPRLSEQESSKDLRDFLSHCLKELPTEVRCFTNRLGLRLDV